MTTAERDDRLQEQRLAGEQVFKGAFLQVFRDEARLTTGSVVRREYIRHPGAVMVVPLLGDGRMVMERQYRYPLGQVLLEFPAGKIDPLEHPFLTGQRELLEETGYRAGLWAPAGRLHNAAAYSDECIEVWFARELEPGAPRPDANELLDVCELGLDDLRSMACSGELTDAKTLIGLLWLEHWQAGRWQPSWGSVSHWSGVLGLTQAQPRRETSLPEDRLP